MSEPLLYEDLELLYKVVRAKYMDQRSSAIILALEGMKWLLGGEYESIVTRESLQIEAMDYFLIKEDL